MERRRFIALLGGAASCPLVADAQQRAASRRIGYLGASRITEATEGFFDEIRRLGYVEGQNLELLFKEFGERPDQLPALATELVRAGVEVIVADGSEAPPRAARASTDRLPIVAVAVNYDPIERGYAAGLAHPGGNVTGVFLRPFELVPKQIELLREMVPQAARLAIIYGADTKDEFAAAEDSAKAQGLTSRPFASAIRLTISVQCSRLLRGLNPKSCSFCPRRLSLRVAAKRPPRRCAIVCRRCSVSALISQSAG